MVRQRRKGREKKHQKEYESSIHMEWKSFFCIPCDGNGICVHGIRKCTTCKEWDGSGICAHGNRKDRCKACGGNALCKTPHCPIRNNPKYDGHCLFCFVHLYPDKPVARNCKTKENTVATFLKEKFPNVTWKCNKSVENGCSRRRPDLLSDMGNRIVIVEVDENSHVVYNSTCEEKHLRELWVDVYHRKIVFVRFNTDGYKDEDGNNVPSPWGVNGHGVLTVRPKWKAAWEVRLEKLRQTVKYYIESSNIKEEFELVHLYYK